MEFHIQCDAKDISRYVFCPGDHARAEKIAAHFENARLVTESRGYRVYSGHYEGVFMTACGTGMGGPTTAIALEELGHMGANTFIRVGSCGVFQAWQGPGDVIISTGTFRAGGTAKAYLPLEFPAVPAFVVTRELVRAAEALGIKYTAGVGAVADAFYAPMDRQALQILVNAGVVSIEMESDTVFVLGAYRGWRTGAIYASDGAPGDVKPEWGVEAFRQGEADAIRITLRAMRELARQDGVA